MSKKSKMPKESKMPKKSKMPKMVSKTSKKDIMFNLAHSSWCAPGGVLPQWAIGAEEGAGSYTLPVSSPRVGSKPKCLPTPYCIPPIPGNLRQARSGGRLQYGVETSVIGLDDLHEYLQPTTPPTASL